MEIANKLTVVVEVTDETQAAALKDFLGVFTQYAAPDALLSYERKRSSDFEDEADKLRAALDALVKACGYDEVEITSLGGNGSDGKAIIPQSRLDPALKAAQSAIAAYDNSVHKQIPF